MSPNPASVPFSWGKHGFVYATACECDQSSAPVTRESRPAMVASVRFRREGLKVVSHDAERSRESIRPRVHDGLLKWGIFISVLPSPIPRTNNATALRTGQPVSACRISAGMAIGRRQGPRTGPRLAISQRRSRHLVVATDIRVRMCQITSAGPEFPNLRCAEARRATFRQPTM